MSNAKQNLASVEVVVGALMVVAALLPAEWRRRRRAWRFGKKEKKLWHKQPIPPTSLPVLALSGGFARALLSPRLYAAWQMRPFYFIRVRVLHKSRTNTHIVS